MKSVNEIKRKAATGAIWKFFERMSAQFVSMIVAIILARILSPDDYSVVGIVSIFFTFSNVFINGGFNAALIQKKDVDNEDYSSVFVISLTVALILYGGLYLCAPLIAKIYQKTILVSVIRTMGIILPVNAIKSVVCAYISKKLQFRKFFFATLGGTVISAIVGITMAFSGYGVWALVIQQMTNIIIDTVILCLATPIRLRLQVSWTRIRALFGYGWHIFVSSMIAAIYTEINPIFIGLKYSGTDLSFYTKGKSFPNMLSTICNSTLSSVLFPVLSKFQNDKDELLRCTRRFIRIGSFLIFPVLLGFYAVADNFILLLLTEKWLPAAQYIRIFCISELFVSIHSGNCEAVKAMGRSDVYLKMEIIKKSCYFLIIGLFMLLTDTPVGLVYSAIGCTVVAIIVNCVPNVRLLGYRISDQIRDIFPNLFSAIVMCLFVSQVPLKGKMIGLELLIQILSGIMIYIGVCSLTHNENLTYVWRSVKSLLVIKI